MPAPTTATQALWLDPFRPLTVADRARLAAAGVDVQPLSTLDDLQTALQDVPAQPRMLVLGLGADIALLNDTLSLVKSAAREIALVCRLERRQLELAVLALHSGACHVLAADDYSDTAWTLAVERAAQGTLAKVAPAAAESRPAVHISDTAVRSVVYVDPVSRNLLALAQRVAQAPVAVLVEGPTGSGKEVLARVLHESSSAANGPFIGLNCAALPEHMIEDMLFGHEKGAFTGAVKEHRGLFEQAQGGTLFLDEIGELPLALQAKLLRVLQERSLVRLGGERAIALDVRVVAATNKNLREQIALRAFREDLYFRLSTFKLRVPPLAERSGDILPLVARLLARHVRGNQPWSVSEEAQRVLLSHRWPGNVRELENIVQRAMVLCPGTQIGVEHLMFDDAPTHFAMPEMSAWTQEAPPVVAASPLQAAVKHSEHHAIRAALEGSRSREEAAQKLGISPRTLRYKLARLRESATGLPAHA
ncbi:MAG: sigma-54 interaction domain-containing protein [Rhodoferax sp.]